jgi:hypothetical protein
MPVEIEPWEITNGITSVLKFGRGRHIAMHHFLALLDYYLSNRLDTCNYVWDRYI